MLRMMGLIAANYSDESFAQLTKARPVASLPFGGRYRLVDFPLSNMVNSGIYTVGLITPYMYRSILDHVGVGKEWSLSRRVGGMFILPGSIYGLKKINGKFLLRDIIQNKQYLERSQHEYVVVTASSKVYNIDFRLVAEAHAAANADITLIYKKAGDNTNSRDLMLELKDGGRVCGLSDKASAGENMFIDAFIINRELLLNITDWYEATSYMDLTEIIADNLDTWRVCSFEFTGYLGKADNVNTYMQTSQDLLNRKIAQELFNPDRPITTKIQDSPPAKYFADADVKNSLISSGCIIRGSVINSIVSRGVTVEKGAVIKNCVIMQNTVIGKAAVLENVICDKYAVIREGVRLYGNLSDPILVGKGQDV